MSYGWARAIITSTVIFMTVEPALAKDLAAEEAANRATIARSFKAWRDGAGGPYDLLAENATWTITGNSLAGKTYASRVAFMNEVIHPFNARMKSPLRPTVRRIYADGDTIIAFFDADGIARDGRPYANTYAWILKMNDGRIVRAHAFFDSIAFDDLWRRVQPDLPTPMSEAAREK